MLNGGSRVRLQNLRRRFQFSLDSIRKHRTPEEAERFILASGYTSPLKHYLSTSPRAHIRSGLFSDAHGPTYGDGYANIPTSVLDGLRDAGKAHAIVPLDHTGWFADPYQDETYTGQVWQLPHQRFIAGYTEADAGYTVLCGNPITIFDNKEDAAYAADKLAERMAEEAREECERDEARQRIEDACDDLRAQLPGIRTAVHELCAALREGPPPKARAILLRDLATERAGFTCRLAKLVKLKGEN